MTHPWWSFVDDGGCRGRARRGRSRGSRECGSARARGSASAAVALARGHHRSKGGSGNGVVHTARGAAFRKERGATPRGLEARTCASWVGDTAEASFASREAPSRKGWSCGSARIGSPIRTNNERGEKVLRASARPRQPFTRLGGVGLGSRVFRPEIVMRSRADAGGHRSAGEARERRSIRGTPTRSAVEGDNPSAPSDGSPKRASRRESASPRIVWEHEMRRAPRREAIVFENKIREQQTSVERTGVAAGPHPRAPGSPNRTCWAPPREKYPRGRGPSSPGSPTRVTS